MSEPLSGGVEVAVVESVWGAALDALAGEVRVHHDPDAWQDRQSLLGAVRGARAVVVRNRTRVDRELLEACADLRVVGRAGVGLDNIDLAAADELGVVVAAPRGANACSVAEHALALALAVSRNLVTLDAGCRAGSWDRVPGRELSGKIWGLLGCGATARACVPAVRGLGMEIVAYDPYVDPAEADLAALGVELVGLPELAATADVVSCHLPATGKTRGIVGSDLLARMKPSVIVVNVGRGEAVDENALADALEAGTVAGAGLDVRAAEPPRRGRLEELGNVVLSPHVAGVTAESQERIAAALVADIRAVLAGGEARHAAGASRKASTR